MTSRNETLRLIVLAAGGTVTTPSNRNSLMLDWLIAVGGS